MRNRGLSPGDGYSWITAVLRFSCAAFRTRPGLARRSRRLFAGSESCSSLDFVMTTFSVLAPPPPQLESSTDTARPRATQAAERRLMYDLHRLHRQDCFMSVMSTIIWICQYAGQPRCR